MGIEKAGVRVIAESISGASASINCLTGSTVAIVVVTDDGCEYLKQHSSLGDRRNEESPVCSQAICSS